MVTSFDVAKLAGVSQPTVSRALRGDSRVSEKTKTAVRKAAAALGYIPSAAGRALSSGRTNRIGLLVTDLSNEFYHRVIGPVVHRVTARDHEVVLLAGETGEADVSERIVAFGLDGVILTTTSSDSTVPYKLRDRSIPFVYFNRVAPAVPADAAVVGSRAGLRDMVDAIVGAGMTRVAMVMGPANATTGFRRSEETLELLGERGIFVPHEYRQQGDFTIETGEDAMRAFFSLSSLPEIVICGNDVIAMGVINAAKEKGIRVPEDIAVTGFDDLPEAAWSVFSLSTVGFDLPALAGAAVDLLFDRIANPKKDFQTVEIPSYYVARRSFPGMK